MMNSTLSLAMNIYINRLLDIYNMKLSDMASNNSYLSVTPNQSANYKPSTNERTIFFVIENGKDAIRYNLDMHKNFYIHDIKLHAEESKQ